MTQKSKITVQVDRDLEDLIPEFLDNRKDDLSVISKALDQGDYETVRVLGHNMKGAGGGYGFDSISDLGKSLEFAAKEENPRAIRTTLDELADYLERVEVIYEE